jgi:hypothetical protein
VSNNWQFHFRNCDVASASGGQPASNNWFGVYHFGCGGVPATPVSDNSRANCFGINLAPDPSGLASGAAVYRPADSVVDANDILDEVLQGALDAANFAVFLASGGTDVGALAQSIGGCLSLSADVVTNAMNEKGVNDAAFLQNYLTGNLETAAETVAIQPMRDSSGRMVASPAEILTSIAEVTLGLAPGTWGFMGGTNYISSIHDNNDNNDQSGFSVLRAPYEPSIIDPCYDYIANHAFINQGHLIYFWDRWYLPGPNNNWGGLSRFWLPLS